VDSETIKLILDMGASGATVEEVTRKLEAHKSTVKTTADTYEVLERQVGEYEVLERRVTETVRIQTTMLDQLGIQLAKHVDLYKVATVEMTAAQAAAGRAGQSFSKEGVFGRGVMQASFAVQDFTSVLGTQGLGGALGSIQNNIPILVGALGAGAGLAGAVSIVSIGVGLLIDNWDKIQRLWGSGKTEEEIERMKRLAKATDEAREAAEKLAKTLPPDVRQAGPEAVKRAVDAFGGEAVVRELAEGLKGARGDFGAENNRKMAETLMANLLQGNRDAIATLRELPLRGQVGQVLSGGQTPQEERREQLKAAQERDRMLDQAKRFQEQKQLKAAQERERLNKQGQDNADRAQRDRERQVRESQQLGRAVDRGFKERTQFLQQRQQVPAQNLQHLPMMPHNADQQQAMNVLLDTQARLAGDMEQTRQFLQRARQLNQRVRSGATAGLP
jgi:hypothetical protein